jgi:hypothetical protein
VSKLKEVTSFARAAFKAEFMTPAGVLNALWMFMTFVLVSGAALGGLYQEIVRATRGEYESGPPAFIWLLVVYGFLSFVCIGIVGFLTRPRD